MPEVSRFYGIVIRLYYHDHNPPHFHAWYAGMEAVIDIKTLAVMSGRLPARALGLVAEWGALHGDELLAAWERARNLESPGRIDPLP